MFRSLVVLSSIAALLYGAVYYHPELKVYIDHVRSKCCSGTTCSLLEKDCFSNLKYLAKRCGSDWNQIYDNCLSAENSSFYCFAFSTSKFNNIVKNCYYVNDI